MANERERARKALRELSKTLKSLPGDLSVRRVHKLRTATRRVEAIATALEATDSKGSRRLLKALEPVRKAAGGVRDMDVLAANVRKLGRPATGAPLARLLTHLEYARQQNADELRRVLSRRGDAARENLKKYGRIVRSALSRPKNAEDRQGLHGATQESIHTAAMNAVRELGEWPPLNAENIHEFRLKVKLLRYLLQISADADPKLMTALADVQRRVGDWHDWQQLEEIAREVLISEQDSELLERIGNLTGRRYEKALGAANSLRACYLHMPAPTGI